MKTEKRIMISRYTRRPVSHNLEIRGLSRSSLDHHPLPEEADDDLLPRHLLHDLQEAVSTYNSSETSAASGRSDCPTATTGDTAQSWSGIHSYTGTGVSTERSSVFSWGYDEFDKAASRQVQQMFEEIDEALYEGRGDGGEAQRQGLPEECQQWASRFPHLRILGSQLVRPSDEGFQWYVTPGTGTASGAVTTAVTKDNPGTELCVQGRRAVLSEADRPSGSTPPTGTQGRDWSRVVEAEGLMEEYLAFDCRDLDEERERLATGGCASGRGGSSCLYRLLPPVTPSRCHRRAVLDLLFDDAWRALVGWAEGLVRRLWEEGWVSDEEKTVDCSPAQPDTQNPFLLLSTLPTFLPRLGQSRAPPPLPPPQLMAGPLNPLQTAKSRGSKHKSRRKSKKQKKPSTSIRVPVGAAVIHHNLNDLIVIHGIPLQKRNLAALERTQEPEERVFHRPGSSAVLSSKARPYRALEQSSSSLSRPPQSARRRNPPLLRTLLPLVPGLSQASAAGSMDEVVRGTRLPTASDRLSSPLALSRNTLLPPIATGDAEPTHSRQHSRPTQRHRGPSSRAHSAVTDEAASSLPRDRHHFLDVFSRPNTTHTYRSDTPYRRSFTVLDSIGQGGRPGRASVGTDSLGIGVTGISLGISRSSFMDSFIHQPLGHSPIEDEEEPDTQDLPPALLVPVSGRRHVAPE